MTDPTASFGPGSRPTFTNEAPRWRVAGERLPQMIRLYTNWPSALANRVGLLRPTSRYTYRVRVGANGRIPLVARGNGFDVRAINEVFIGRVYDRWYEGPVPAGAVIDVGANCGYFSILAGKVMRPTRLVCIEPDPGNRSLLEANLARNGLSAEIVPGAVVAESADETIVLRRSNDPRLHTVLAPRAAKEAGLSDRGAGAGDLEVPAFHLDDVLGRTIPEGCRISFLKVDIEGPEWEVLASLSNDTWRRIDCLVVESDSEMPRDVRQRLQALEFDIHADRPFWAIRRS